MKDDFVQFTSPDHPPGPWNVRKVAPGLMTDIYWLLEIDETWNNWRQSWTRHERRNSPNDSKNNSHKNANSMDAIFIFW